MPNPSMPWYTDDTLHASAVLRRAYSIDLRKPVRRQRVDEALVQGDQRGYQIALRLTRGEETLVRAESITGYLVRPDGQTIALPGIWEGEAALVTLTSDCLTVPGHTQLLCRAVTDGGTVASTVLVLDFTVIPGAGDDAQTGGGTLVATDALLAEISRLEQASQQAVSDADHAIASAAAARAEAEEAARTANQAAEAATEAAGSVSDALSAILPVLDTRAGALVMTSPEASSVTVYADGESALLPRLTMDEAAVPGDTPSPDHEIVFPALDALSLTVNGDTVSIPLPSACVGGYIDWKRGKYVQTHVLDVYDDSIVYKRIVQPALMIYSCDVIHQGRLVAANMLRAVPQSYFSNAEPGTCWISETGLLLRLVFDGADERFLTVSSFTQFVREHPLLLLIELNEPIEHDIALPRLSALPGENTASCAEGGRLSLTYNAQLTHVIEDLYARLAAAQMTDAASPAYAGDGATKEE